MGQIFLLLLTSLTCGVSLGKPHVGIFGYYLLALLGPQYIWFWYFEGIRISFYIALFALIGVVLGLMNRNFDFSFVKTSINKWIIVLWGCIVLSYFMGPFVNQHKPVYGMSPGYLFSQTNNIYLFYLCATLAINDVKKIRVLGFVLVITTLYLVYWANMQYFTSNWSQFSFGRLKGPSSADGGSIYRDENAFAMLFVTGTPFIYYYFQQLRHRWARWFCFAIVVFALHAVFLTGSRGGFLGLVVTLLATVLMSKRKMLALLFVPAFLLFFQWQGGSTMKQRSGTMDQYEEDRSAEMRLEAWKGGMRMVQDHPVTGVGLGSFITALPHYNETSPRVAHNTFIQFTAESGLLAGAAYLMILFTFLANTRRTATWCRHNPDHDDTGWVRALNSATGTSFLGLVVCSVFLSLNNYEIFFFLLVLNNALGVLCALPAGETDRYPASVLVAQGDEVNENGGLHVT